MARTAATYNEDGELIAASAAYNKLSAPEQELVRLPQSAMCIASACMMWRLATTTEYDDVGVITYVGPDGYCGLAGKI